MPTYFVRETTLHKLDAPTAKDALERFIEMDAEHLDRCFVGVMERDVEDDSGTKVYDDELPE